MNDHIVFFDDECPLCHRAVHHLIDIDPEKFLLFAPLRGKTAREILTGPQFSLKNTNGLILVENYRSTERKFSIRSRAIFRIYWLLDHIGIGLFSFLPGWMSDPFYNWFAAHRHQFKLRMPNPGIPADRLLP